MAREDKDLRAALRRLDDAIVRQEKFLRDALASEGAPAAKPLRDDLLVMRDEAARLRRRLLAP